MPRKFKLKIVEGKTAADLEQKVETVVQEIEGEILNSRYQRTPRNYVAFIEYATKETPRNRVGLSVESPTYHAGEEFKTFKKKIIEQADKTYLQNILEEHEGNISKASAAAGIGRFHFRKLLKKYDLCPTREKKMEE